MGRDGMKMCECHVVVWRCEVNELEKGVCFEGTCGFDDW